ncbi:hypothetical protein GGE65_007309 [Skermanella aerolata]
MNEDNIIVQFHQPDEIDDPMTALLRSGVRQLLEGASHRKQSRVNV